MPQELIKNLIKKTLQELNYPEIEVKLEHPELSFGDYSTNVALVLAKKIGDEPEQIAQAIRENLLSQADPNMIADIKIAGPGFINFYLTTDFFARSLEALIAEPENFGQNQILAGKKILIEYTDPNPFKEFHIGHLMSNTIGEALSRAISYSGAELKRACYQGDLGLHVAMTLWGMLKLEGEMPGPEADLSTKVKFLGRAYAFGSSEYREGSENAKEGIVIINKKLYKKSDSKLNELYDLGRKWSLDYFETIYQRLGTKFDYYFFESETGEIGQKIVEEGLANNVFEKSEGAIVFRGENFDPKLHTRVFLNAEGLPTYEAKELGLAKLKAARYLADTFISITGNEINDYFKVIQQALHEIDPDLSTRILHLSHGMLRLPEGKMSSRTGKVITAELLIDEVKEMVRTKIKDRELSAEERQSITEAVAIGAIKYSILKQSIGKDIIFDIEKSLSFEGDSGPYLQYTYTRARSVLLKAGERGSDFRIMRDNNLPLSDLERLLYRLPEIVESTYLDLAPQKMATYLIEVAGTFNSFYAQNQIIGGEYEDYFLALTQATTIVLKRGLDLLAIPVLEKM